MKGLREKPEGSGRYELSFYNKRKQPKRVYVRFEATSYEYAIKRAFEFMEAHERGDFDPWNKKTDNIADAIDAYLKAHRHQRKNTINGKRSTLKLFLENTSRRSFSSIDVDIITQYAARFMTNATRRTRLHVLSGFWGWCVQEGYTKRNPVADYLRKHRQGRKASKQRDAMKMDEYMQVYGAAMLDDCYFPPFIELGVCTGLRRGELISLNVRDVTLEGSGGSINIREWISPATGEHFVPKHEHERVVPLVPRAAALLRQLIDDLRTDDPWQHIFHNPHNPDERVKPNDASTRFRAARRSVGLGDSYTLHSTRHTFLSWLVMCGVDPYALKEIAGHSDLQTQQRYVHFSKVMLSGGASRVRREIVSYLCPGVSDNALAFAFPDSSTWYGSAAPGSRLNILDILFGGMLYDAELLQALSRSEMRRGAGRN